MLMEHLLYWLTEGGKYNVCGMEKTNYLALYLGNK